MKNNIIGKIIRGLFGVDLPEPRGLDLQKELARTDVQIPIMFLAGQGALPMSVRATPRGDAVGTVCGAEPTNCPAGPSSALTPASPAHQDFFG